MLRELALMAGGSEPATDRLAPGVSGIPVIRPAGEPLAVRIEAIRFAAPGIHTFEFRDPSGAPLPAFAPGAHVDVHLQNGLVRQYSILSAPEDTGRYVVAVRHDPKGRGGSRWLFDRVRVGDLLTIGAPRNHFPLREDAPTSVLIAGGIGITPIVCMVERLARTGRDWHLFYAVRTREQAAFLDRFARFGERVELHVDDERGGPLEIARVVAAAPPGADLYCCGPAPMLDAFEAAAAGRPAAQVHVERFAAAEPPAAEGGFDVELARSQRRIRVAPGETIATALLRAGVRVTVSCEQGVCGTCETRVLAGEPDHRDSLLSQEEKAANDVMMICCSGSRSATLVLDL